MQQICPLNFCSSSSRCCVCNNITWLSECVCLCVGMSQQRLEFRAIFRIWVFSPSLQELQLFTQYHTNGRGKYHQTNSSGTNYLKATLLFLSLPIFVAIADMFVEKSNLKICLVVKSQLSEDSVSPTTGRQACMKVMRCFILEDKLTKPTAFAVRWIF